MITKFLRFGQKQMQSTVLSRFSETKQFENNFLTTTNLQYIESLYSKWQDDKKSVSPSFSAYFQELEKGTDPDSAFVKPPTPGSTIEFASQSTFVGQQLKLKMMIERYRTIGHQFAKVDPLGFQRRDFVGAVDPKILSIEAFEFTEAQLRQKYELRNSRAPDAEIAQYTVQDMQNYLKKIYTSHVGFQYTHLMDKTERDFLKSLLQENIEILHAEQPDKEQSLKAFEKLCKDQMFIDFLGNKFANFKRFGVQGLNSVTSALEQIVQFAAENHGVENIIMGMAHRGRINVLHCVFDKPAAQIFKQFLQKQEEDDISGSGDVKYHLGLQTTKKVGDKQINLQILPNPSHLQTVNPLVYGSVRAYMQMSKDPNGDKTMGVLVHGDAAMSGQGIISESIQMQGLFDYSPNGIIHVVMNNQIGFTTNPAQGRSSYYCTEIAKTVGAPVFHVNANQPAVLRRCVKIAVAYRNKFKKDIFIDVVGYRRYGHNEQDQPFFTQPQMYNVIKNKKTTFDEYADKLIDKNVITPEQVKQRKQHYTKHYQEEYKKVINDKHQSSSDEVVYKYYELKKPELWGNNTGVAKNSLTQIFKKLTTWPEDFNLHPTIKKIYEQRIKNFNGNQPLDWATMESLAFGSLLYEGYGVRLSGQDVERGTFSHRHAYISDQKKDVPKYLFLKSLSNKVTISNSHLSEYGVMGFQFGYSIQNPNNLTIWEAQFGDFANGASIMIDNYVTSCESKWGIQSGLVLNLPHGMDGQGPEHSSARMERFLHLSDDNTDVDQNITYEQQLKTGNIQIIGCTTSSNYFHALRRQIRRQYRKPLILFNSKKLLKLKAANRTVKEIEEGTGFVPVYEDESGNPASGIKKVLLCNGQFYYELRNKRDELKLKDVAIVRIEQVAPFPFEQLKKVLSQYGSDVKYCWAQEEHQNYGAWNYIYPRLKLLLNKPIKFYGRNASAATAVGALKIHKQEEQELLNQIFGSQKKQ